MPMLNLSDLWQQIEQRRNNDPANQADDRVRFGDQTASVSLSASNARSQRSR